MATDTHRTAPAVFTLRSPIVGAIGGSETEVLSSRVFYPILIGGAHGRVGSTFLRRVLSTHPDISPVGHGETRLVEYAADLRTALAPDGAYSPRHGASALQEFRHKVEASIGSTPGIRAALDRLTGDLRATEMRWPGSKRTEVPALVTPSTLLKALGRCLSLLMFEIRIDPNRPIGCEKTPSNAQYIRFIRSSMPESRIVVLMRHPVDVALSHTQRDWGPTDPIDAARYTAAYFRRWRHVAESVPRGEFILIRHEELVESPEATMASIARFVGVEPLESWTQTVLQSVRRSADRRSSISPKVLSSVEEILSEEIQAAGYGA